MAAHPIFLAAVVTSKATQIAIWYLVFLFVVYFILIRPQAQRQRHHRRFIDGLEKGDEVVTAGGIYGKIRDLTADSVRLDVGGNVTLKVSRNAISRYRDPEKQKQVRERKSS